MEFTTLAFLGLLLVIYTGVLKAKALGDRTDKARQDSKMFAVILILLIIVVSVVATQTTGTTVWT